ncbi:MAG: hypothetical protein KBA26_06785 [Candidatus Delongbacteria bacterium]|nr:hypothetical protein [Candidatus Delongbacteria bacterium]
MKTIVLILFILSSLISGALYAVPPSKKPDRILSAPDSSSVSLTVYYFHTDTRCQTCHLMEEYAQQAIKTGFTRELENKTIIWRIVNVDRDENKHYINDFQLYTKSIIVEKTRHGKKTWKNLDKIWDYVSDQAKYTRYIQDEIKSELGS